jgi:ornithine cyclodeaminase
VLVCGDELGARPTGAIGAVAVDAAARPGAIRLGLVGAGTQAWTQLWAVRAVRPVTSVTVAARRPERAAAFAKRAADELGLTVRAVTDVRDAVRDQDVVIVATYSVTPVFEADWIAPGTHVTTLGPKSVTRHEVPAALAGRADVILTDSPAQLVAYPEPFCSVGLAGTEVAIAAALSGSSET